MHGLHTDSCPLQTVRTAQRYPRQPTTSQPSRRTNTCARAQAAKEAHIPAVTPAPETATWDPNGILSRTPAAGGHFARRDRKQSQYANVLALKALFGLSQLRPIRHSEHSAASAGLPEAHSPAQMQFIHQQDPATLLKPSCATISP